MKHIFEPVQLGNLCLKNRLVRSATMENAAITDGIITPALKETYEELARGGVGLIITGMMNHFTDHSKHHLQLVYSI